MFTTTREAGILVRGLREDAGLTGAQLADRARVSRRWLVNLENGKPSLDMARVLDCFEALGFGLDLTPLPPEWND